MKKKMEKRSREEGNAAESAEGKQPQKKFYRSRAHANPLSDPVFDYPVSPDAFDWEKMYPEKKKDDVVVHTDVGCGFGGLLIQLGSLFPDKMSLGLEIRPKVAQYVEDRILALRKENPGQYNNVAVLRTNAMKLMANYIKKGQLEKMFFCFPDPHFKAKNFRRRVINHNLLAEYAYFLKVGGILYTITDVEDLHIWMKEKCETHPCFVPVSEEELKADVVVPFVYNSSEEAAKVSRNEGKKYLAVFRRIEPPMDQLPFAATVDNNNENQSDDDNDEQ